MVHEETGISDDSNLNQWVNGIVAVEPVGELQGGVGDRVRVTVDMPRRMEIVSTTEEWEPHSRMKFSNDLKSMPGWVAYELESQGEGTLLTFTAEHQPRGFLMWLIQPILRRVFNRERPLELERLKQALEGEAETVS